MLDVVLHQKQKKKYSFQYTVTIPPDFQFIYMQVAFSSQENTNNEYIHLSDKARCFVITCGNSIGIHEQFIF